MSQCNGIAQYPGVFHLSVLVDVIWGLKWVVVVMLQLKMLARRSASGIISLASHLWNNTSRRRHQVSSSFMSTKRPSEGPPLERPVPPKKPFTTFNIYVSERFKNSKGEKLSLSTIGREWREMSPQRKARYKEDYQRRHEEYRKQMKEFSQNFACKIDQWLYLLSIKKRGKATAFSAMKKDRASKLPSEEREDYVLRKAKEDYKNLTSSELQTYQHMADNINKENKNKNQYLHKPSKISVYKAMFVERTANRPLEEVIDYPKKAKRELDNLTDTELRAYEELANGMHDNNWQKYIDQVFSKPKISALDVMKKERAAKLPQKDRVNYVFRLSSMDYKNLSVQERQEYQKITDDLNKKRIKIYEAIQQGCED